VERAFLAMIEAVKRSVPLRELEALLRQGNLSAIDQALDVDTRMREAAEGKGVPPGESLFEVLQTVYQAGARAEQGVLATKPVVKAELGVEMSLNLLNPESVAFLQAYTFSLIREVSDSTRLREVSDSTRLAIRDVVLRAFNEGGHPFEQARTIRNLIGLTNRQGQAVTNFRNMLQSGDPAKMQEALERALRDRRFDPTVFRAIQQQAAIPKARVDRMVQRYYDRYLNYRARNIARTETLRASNAGQQEVWRQAEEQGFLPPDRTRRKWIVTPDDRLCPLCQPVPGMNKEGVGLREGFNTPIGPVQYPPLHPSCRCTTGLMFLPRRPRPLVAPTGLKQAQSLEDISSNGLAISRKLLALPAVRKNRRELVKVKKRKLEHLGENSRLMKSAKARINKLRAEGVDIKGDALVTKFWDEADAAMNKALALNKEIIRLEDEARSLFNTTLRRTGLFGAQAKASPRITAAPGWEAHIHGDVGDGVNDAASWLTGLIDIGRVPTHMRSMPTHIDRIQDGRSYHRSGAIYMHALQGRKQSASTFAHEMGHYLEDARPDVLQFSSQFLAQRSRGKPLRVIGRSWGHDERAYRGAFPDDYTGKLYVVSGSDVPHATEVLSMGLQKIHDDPFEFANSDSKHFRYTLGVLHHLATTDPVAIAEGLPVFNSATKMLVRATR
jgi:hypothetical protein